MPTIQATPMGKSQGDSCQQQQEQIQEPAILPLPRRPWHMLCLALRAEIEAMHRREIYKSSTYPTGPEPVCLDTVGEMSQESLVQSFNRSVPIFLWPVKAPEPPEKRALLLVSLHNFLYRTWFHPFRSEIDWGQFLAQTFEIGPDVMTDAIEAPADLAFYTAYLSHAICAVAARIKRRKLHGLGHRTLPRRHRAITLFLRPLFRAVAIITKETWYNLQLTDIGQMPVLLVLTGVEEGLSAPITFEPVADQIHAYHRHPLSAVQAAETSLATAVRFVMDLEKREEAALGPRPDPRQTGATWARSAYLDGVVKEELCLANGWDVYTELPAGSSATWVDTVIYPYWTGAGAVLEQEFAEESERQWRRAAMETEQREKKGGEPGQG